jgi:hypothetical protein
LCHRRAVGATPRPTETRLSVIPFEGALIDVRGLQEVMAYWDSLSDETVHVDLFARPTN